MLCPCSGLLLPFLLSLISNFICAFQVFSAPVELEKKMASAPEAACAEIDKAKQKEVAHVTTTLKKEHEAKVRCLNDPLN